MVERFSDRARRVLVLAQEEAQGLGHDWLGSEHVLLGLVEEGDGEAAQALDAVGLVPAEVRQTVCDLVGVGAVPDQADQRQRPFTPRVRRVLERALSEALAMGHDHIGTRHLLLGLLDEGEGVAVEVLAKLGADVADVRRHLLAAPAARGDEDSPGLRRRRFIARTRHEAGVDQDRDVGLERLTDRALRAFLDARAERRRLAQEDLEPEHLLVALLGLDGDPAQEALQACGLAAPALRRVLEGAAPEARDDGGSSRLAALTWRVLGSAAERAGDQVGTLDLLAALVGHSSAVRLAVSHSGGDLDVLRARLVRNTAPPHVVGQGPELLGETDTNRDQGGRMTPGW